MLCMSIEHGTVAFIHVVTYQMFADGGIEIGISVDFCSKWILLLYPLLERVQ
jgi:hypothetical protein